jgi:hypothetical protein
MPRGLRKRDSRLWKAFVPRRRRDKAKDFEPEACILGVIGQRSRASDAIAAASDRPGGHRWLEAVGLGL